VVTRVPENGNEAPAASKLSPSLSPLIARTREQKKDEKLGKRLLPGVMSSLKDDGGRGPSPSLRKGGGRE